MTRENRTVKQLNTTARVFVRAVIIEKEEPAIKCPHGSGPFPCRDIATTKLVVGSHTAIACNDEDHIENAELQVAQKFVEEMLDKYGGVPEWRHPLKN